MDFSSNKTWRNIAIAVGVIAFIAIKLYSSVEESNSTSTSDISSDNLCGTYVSYPNEDRRITRTYVLNSNGSATVTFKSVWEVGNRTETDTDTDYGYWQRGNGYIEVIYEDDGYTDMDYLDLSEKKVYSGYQNYRSRYIGVEFVKSK